MPDAGARRLATATVLFVDLAGSTAQRVALGDDAADDLTAAFDRMSRDTVAAYDGNVVKGTGDGLMAVFTAASDAVGAAVAIHQAAEQHNRSVDAPRHLSIRIGCSAGDVQFEAGDCRGTPVVEAARLEAASTVGRDLGQRSGAFARRFPRHPRLRERGHVRPEGSSRATDRTSGSVGTAGRRRRRPARRRATRSMPGCGACRCRTDSSPVPRSSGARPSGRCWTARSVR